MPCGCCCQSRSLSRIETQDIKTQPQFNHYMSDIWVFLFQAFGICLALPFSFPGFKLTIQRTGILMPLTQGPKLKKERKEDPRRR